MCATHGALFEVETGLCIDGPCMGDYLKPLQSSIVKDEVIITL